MHQPAQLEGGISPVLHECVAGGAQVRRSTGVRVEEGADHLRKCRRRATGTGLSGGGTDGHIDGRALAGSQLAPQTGLGERRGQGHATPTVGRGHRIIGDRSLRRRRPIGVERVEAHRPTWAQGHRHHTPGVGQRPVLALRVDHPGVTTEDGLAPEVGLEERALASTDLADDHHVRVGDDSLPVEGEGVVDEGTAEQVAADEDTVTAQTGLGHQRIGGAQVTGGGHMSGDARSELHDRPRPSGREQAKATSCSP